MKNVCVLSDHESVQRARGNRSNQQNTAAQNRSYIVMRSTKQQEARAKNKTANTSTHARESHAERVRKREVQLLQKTENKEEVT